MAKRGALRHNHLYPLYYLLGDRTPFPSQAAQPPNKSIQAQNRECTS